MANIEREPRQNENILGKMWKLAKWALVLGGGLAVLEHTGLFRNAAWADNTLGVVGRGAQDLASRGAHGISEGAKNFWAASAGYLHRPGTALSATGGAEDPRTYAAEHLGPPPPTLER